MHQMIKEAKEYNTTLPNKYYRYEWAWYLLGWPAFISVLIIFYLMVAKITYIVVAAFSIDAT